MPKWEPTKCSTLPSISLLSRKTIIVYQGEECRVGYHLLTSISFPALHPLLLLLLLSSSHLGKQKLFFQMDDIKKIQWTRPVFPRRYTTPLSHKQQQQEQSAMGAITKCEKWRRRKFLFENCAKCSKVGIIDESFKREETYTWQGVRGRYFRPDLRRCWRCNCKDQQLIDRYVEERDSGCSLSRHHCCCGTPFYPVVVFFLYFIWQLIRRKRSTIYCQIRTLCFHATLVTHGLARMLHSM